MNDITCAKCGEPYSQYSLRHEVPEWDDQPDDAYTRCMCGNGCPTCQWGELAGETSVSRYEDPQAVRMKHHVSLIMNSEEDPAKYIL